MSILDSDTYARLRYSYIGILTWSLLSNFFRFFCSHFVDLFENQFNCALLLWAVDFWSMWSVSYGNALLLFWYLWFSFDRLANVLNVRSIFNFNRRDLDSHWVEDLEFLCRLNIRVQNFFISYLSSNIFSGHMNEILIFSLFLTHSISIQTSLKRFRKCENLPIHLSISIFPLLAQINWQNKFQWKILGAPLIKGISKYLEVLDSIFCSQRFSIEKSFVHFCIFDKSVLQCWSSFSCLKHCKILPIIDQLLILELRSWSTTEWCNFRSDSTCSCSLIFCFCAICTNHRFDVLLTHSAGNIGKSSRSSSKSLIISVVETLNNTHSTETGTLQESYSMESCVRQDPLLVQQPSLRYHFVVVILFSLCKPYVTRIRH